MDFKTNIALYGYQERAISVTENKENGVFVSPPGSGKTIMALKIIEQKKQDALIIVHRKELLDQWKRKSYGIVRIFEKGNRSDRVREEYTR